MDPRAAVVARRVSGVDRIIAATGGKGGIGKSLVATGLAVSLARAGRRVGLLDLDFTGPCDHIVLGAEGGFPEEEFGILPPVVVGIHFMSVTHFAGEEPAPLRGVDLSNALVEVLAITQWGELDYLVIDMPPGLGDATLDVVRLLPRAEYLVVATRSRLVVETVRRTLELLRRLQTPMLGVVENMARSDSDRVPDLAARFGVPFLGSLPFDEELEEALGDPDQLANTRFGREVSLVAGRYLAGYPAD